MFERMTSNDPAKKIAGRELSGKTTKSLWERVKSSRVGAFFFGGRERLIIDPKAQVKTDEQGRIIDIEGNESGEVLSLMLEVSGNDQDFWREISNLTFEHAKEQDPGLESRVQAITQRSLEALSSGGEYTGRDLSIREGEIMLAWISRVSRVLRKKREGSVEGGEMPSVATEETGEMNIEQQTTSERGITETKERRSKELDRFQNSIIASTFFDDISQYGKMESLFYQDIFSNEEYKQYQDRIVQTSIDLVKRAPVAKDLFAMEHQNETLANWVERISRLVPPSQMEWPLGKASKLAQSLTEGDGDRWKTLRDKRFSTISEEEKESIFKLAENSPSFRESLNQSETVEVVLQRIAHLEKQQDDSLEENSLEEDSFREAA